MNTIKQIGIIECGTSAKMFELSPISKSQGYQVSKILYKNNIPENFINKYHPEARVITDHYDLINDDAIEMVIVSSPSGDHMNIVGEMLKANKPTRVV